MIRQILKGAARGAWYEWQVARAVAAKSRGRRLGAGFSDLKRAYLFSSEKGLYRLDRTGIYQLNAVPTYGIALYGKWFYCAIHVGGYSFLMRGDRSALGSPRRRFHFQECYRLRVLSTNHRIHQIALGSRHLWVANTGRNTLLQVEPATGRVLAEIPVFLDRFGKPMLFDHNHINSVDEYDGVVVFASYRAGGQSLLGVLDGSRVTGYGYCRTGVHDIYLRPDGLLFCDTFGENTTSTGGRLVTDSGILDEAYFSKPPGRVLRGAAGSDDELVVGHSHKGPRSKRFKGNGSLLLLRQGRVVDEVQSPSSQVYQILTEDGQFLLPKPQVKHAESVRALFSAVLGQPIYEAEVEPLKEKASPIDSRMGRGTQCP